MDADEPPGALAGDSPEMTERLAGQRDQISEQFSAVVVHRLFSAGLALQGALALLDGHHAAAGIERAVTDLDVAIRDIRTIVFGTRHNAARSGDSAA